MALEVPLFEVVELFDEELVFVPDLEDLWVVVGFHVGDVPVGKLDHTA